MRRHIVRRDQQRCPDGRTIARHGEHESATMSVVTGAAPWTRVWRRPVRPRSALTAPPSPGLRRNLPRWGGAIERRSSGPSRRQRPEPRGRAWTPTAANTEEGLLSTPYERGDISRLCNHVLRVMRHRHSSKEEQNEGDEYDLERCHRRALHAP